MSPPRSWRLLLDGPLPGGRNMALDQAILECVAEGSSPPTLRLYRWETPTVSLGRFQPLGHVDMDACARHRVDVVRRPTGGRGVLHDDELTYSMLARVSDGVPRGTAASYAHLSGPLAEAYRVLGVEAELTRRERGDGSSGACYLHATRADLSAGSAKLSGSAQVWSRDAVLQHGSIVRSRDIVRESEVFGLAAQAARALAETTATLADLLSRVPPFDDLVEALCRSVRLSWGISLTEGRCSERELGLAAERVSRFDARSGR